MRAEFLTVAAPHIGLGHLYRCEALATAMVQRGVQTELVVDCRNGYDWLAAREPQTPWTIALWTDSPEEASRAISVADSVIIDAYEIIPEVRRVIAETVDCPVWFDDYGSNIPDRGIVINGSPGAHLVGYPELPGLVFLLGTNYQVLRKPFWEPTHRTTKESVESVGVVLGATDPRGLLQDVLCDVRESVPAGTSVYAIGVEPGTIAENHARATGRLTAQGMKDLFDRLDLLVTAAGQTVAEAVSCGLPTIMIQTAENQRFNISGWSAGRTVLNGGVAVSASPSESKAPGLSQKIREGLNASVRESLQERADELQIHQSTQSVATTLSRLRCFEKDTLTATPFPLLKNQALREVLSWRNDPRVSRWMENTEQITWQDHCHFASALAHDDTKAFFRVDHRTMGLGVVDLTNIDRTERQAELGIYRNPNLSGYRVNGETVGKMLMYMVEFIAALFSISTLWLKVRRNNGRAVRLYDSLGYRCYDSDGQYQYYEKNLP